MKHIHVIFSPDETLPVHYFLQHPVREPDSGTHPSNAPIYYSKSDGCGPFCSGSAIKCEERPKQKKSSIGEICWDEVIVLLSLSR